MSLFAFGNSALEHSINNFMRVGEGEGMKTTETRETKDFSFFISKCGFSGVLCYNGIIIFRKMKQFAGIFLVPSARNVKHIG